MRKRKRHILILALLAVGLIAAMLFMTACEEETTETTAGGTETTAAEGAFTGEPLTIGVLNSITGVNALTGQEQKWAQEKAVADKNAAGGITLADGKTHEIVLNFYDDKSSDTEAAAAMEKAIKTDGLKIFLSSNTTPYNQAAATVAEQYEAYYHINTSWTDEASPDGSFPGFIGGMDLEWSTDIFESAGDAGLAALGAAENMTEPITNMAVMTENNPDGIGFGDGTVAALEGAGYTVVSYEKFVEGQKDFSSIILKFKEADVEGIVVLISPADGITFVNQLKEQDWAPKFMFGYKGFWPVEFMRALEEKSDYICFDGFWTETYPYPYAEELGAAFTETHDGATSVSIGKYITVPNSAARKVGSSRFPCGCPKASPFAFAAVGMIQVIGMRWTMMAMTMTATMKMGMIWRSSR